MWNRLDLEKYWDYSLICPEKFKTKYRLFCGRRIGIGKIIIDMRIGHRLHLQFMRTRLNSLPWLGM